jgi:hypothetical protein
MSLENAQEMVELLKSDTSLATQYAMTTSKEGVLDLSIKLGEENNLDFTKEEFEEALTTKGYILAEDGSLSGGNLTTYVGDNGELDEEALEAVAGGLCYSNSCNTRRGGGFSW